MLPTRFSLGTPLSSCQSESHRRDAGRGQLPLQLPAGEDCEGSIPSQVYSTCTYVDEWRADNDASTFYMCISPPSAGKKAQPARQVCIVLLNRHLTDCTPSSSSSPRIIRVPYAADVGSVSVGIGFQPSASNAACTHCQLEWRSPVDLIWWHSCGFVGLQEGRPRSSPCRCRCRLYGEKGGGQQPTFVRATMLNEKGFLPEQTRHHRLHLYPSKIVMCNAFNPPYLPPTTAAAHPCKSDTAAETLTTPPDTWYEKYACTA